MRLRFRFNQEIDILTSAFSHDVFLLCCRSLKRSHWMTESRWLLVSVYRSLDPAWKREKERIKRLLGTNAVDPLLQPGTSGMAEATLVLFTRRIWSGLTCQPIEVSIRIRTRSWQPVQSGPCLQSAIGLHWMNNTYWPANRRIFPNNNLLAKWFMFNGQQTHCCQYAKKFSMSFGGG